MNRGGLALLVLAVTACTAPSPKTPPIPFALDANGVQLLDREQRIDFGRTDHSAEAAMTKLVGSGPTEAGACANSASFVAWDNGPTLIFQNGDFRGWKNGSDSAGLSCA